MGDYQAIIEGILFLSAEAVPIGRIAEALGIGRSAARELLRDLAEKYQAEGRGMEIFAIEDCWQMRTAPHIAPFMAAVFGEKRQINLSAPLLETLAVIACSQPCSKPEIEAIRGVSADHGVNRLLELGLIQESGRAQSAGKPLLFTTTPDFLRHFGLASVEDLKEFFNHG